MGMGKTAPMIPGWAMTIGAMQAAGARAQVWCSGGCGGSRWLDLPALIAIVGPDYSLLDRRCRCRLTPGCAGWNRFRYSAGENTMAWNLVTEEGLQRWIDRDYAVRQYAARVMREQAEARERKKAMQRH